MKKYDLHANLYTFKNNNKLDINYGSIILKNILNYDNLNIESLKLQKSNEIGYFYDDSKKNEKERIDFFYILEGSIKFVKKNKILQKRDCFTISSLAKDTEYIILKNLEFLHISIGNDEEELIEFTEGIHTLSESGTKCLEKDAYTAGHNYRVCAYAEDIARKLNLSTNEIVAIGTSARFHDVGKVEIEDDVLFKQGALTDDEFEHIKSHTKYGYEMTKDYPDKYVPLMIRQHHERLDGTGYPDGVKDDELLFGSQIISVADIYDALATERPYKKAFSPAKALDILYENANKHYKKEIVDALKEILTERNLI